MKKDDDAVTLFKVRLTREGRDLWVLFKILAVVCSIIASIGMMQVYFCRENHAKWTILECLRP